MPALHPAGEAALGGPPQHGERMQRQGPFAGIAAVACILALGGCAEMAASTGAAGRPGSPDDASVLRIEMVDAEVPAAFSREGVGRREPEGSAAGLWASVAGLPRAERGRLRNLGTGAEVVVALFVAPRGDGSAADPRLGGGGRGARHRRGRERPGRGGGAAPRGAGLGGGFRLSCFDRRAGTD
jgi:hypothetical protein